MDPVVFSNMEVFNVFHILIFSRYQRPSYTLPEVRWLSACAERDNIQDVYFASVQHLAQIIPHQFDSNPFQCHCLLSSTYSASQLLNSTVREVQLLFFFFSNLFPLMKNGSCQIWQTAHPIFSSQSYTPTLFSLG